MCWMGTDTKYGSQMPISELLQVVAEIESTSGLSIYDILMYFQEGYILQEQPVRKQFYNIGGYIYYERTEQCFIFGCADTSKSAKQLMDAFTFSNMHELSKVSRAERTVYLKDGRIFKFTSMTSNNRIVRNLRNWNIYSGKAFEEEFLNDNK